MTAGCVPFIPASSDICRSSFLVSPELSAPCRLRACIPLDLTLRHLSSVWYTWLFHYSVCCRSRSHFGVTHALRLLEVSPFYFIYVFFKFVFVNRKLLIRRGACCWILARYFLNSQHDHVDNLIWLTHPSGQLWYINARLDQILFVYNALPYPKPHGRGHNFVFGILRVCLWTLQLYFGCPQVFIATDIPAQYIISFCFW